MALLNSNKSLKGSTLIETLVAMTIILISLVLSGIIFINVLNSDNNSTVFRAHTLLNEVAIKTKIERKFIDEKLEDGKIVIQKTVHPFNSINNLHLQSLTASDANGKILGEYKELIFTPE